MARKRKNKFSRSLAIVQKFSPKVTKVVDADHDIDIEVTKHDATTSARRKHEGCAMAVACRRKLHLDNVIMARTSAYLIKGHTATRYRVPENVTREVISFDRGGQFEPGEYSLVKPPPYRMLGIDMHERANGGKKTGQGTPHRRHVTLNVRAALALKRVAD